MTTRRKRLIRHAGKPLTKREIAVWMRVAAGRTSKEIAKDLSISIRTAEADRDILRVKLEAKRTADLIAKWYSLSDDARRKTTSP